MVSSVGLLVGVLVGEGMFCPDGNRVLHWYGTWVFRGVEGMEGRNDSCGCGAAATTLDGDVVEALEWMLMETTES